jgi:enoyl-CoA hydratase/carnithine racemase
LKLPTYDTLDVSMPEPHVLLVTLNRPEVRNAFNTQMASELLDLWTRRITQPEDARCIVLTGAGDGAFCAGADLKERRDMTQAAWRAQHELFERAFWAMLDIPVPVIAAVNGPAYAGGLEMTLMCDFIYAVRSARFALTEATLGIMPGVGGTQNLPRAVGARRAREIIFTGRPFSAVQAHEWGLVNLLCEPGELMPTVMDTARAIAQNAPLSIRQAKKSMQLGLEMDLKSGLRFEVEAYNQLIGTDDQVEGIRAFNEKRKPTFRGR